MTDLTLEDLAGTAVDDDGDGGGSSSSASSGKWAMELFDRLDDKGLLEPLIFGPGALGGDEPVNVPSDTAATDGGDVAGDALDADTVAKFGKVIIDNVGDVPLSQIVRYAEENPERVDALIGQALDE